MLALVKFFLMQASLGCERVLTGRMGTLGTLTPYRRSHMGETLVVWSGEFGRTAMNERRNGSTYFGRDHHPHCFSIWMAGGGVRPGIVHGETCEFGSRIVRDPVHVHDLQATVLRTLGFDHEQLVRRHQGRDFRLTDVHGKVVEGLLA